MYRSRFNTNIDRTTLNYISSIDDDLKIIFYDIIGSQAHVIMLYENKIITKDDSRKILIELENLKKKTFVNEYHYDDIHELIESIVVKNIGLSCGGKMHTALSRNDQISFDIRMKLRDDINTLCICLIDTIETLISLANKHKKTVMPLYTHLQQAQIGLFSHYLLSYADSLLRDFDRLYTAYDRINECPLGAGPIGGTSIAINRQTITEMLRFKRIIDNSIDATSARDFAAEYVSIISILMTNLSRMSEDFIIWSTSEFSLIELSDEFTSTSSIMPQKKNPDVLEVARGNASIVIGNLVSILTTLKGLPTGYNRDLQQIKPSLWSTSEISINSLLVIKLMLNNIIVKKENMKKIMQDSNLISLDIVEKLVKKKISFRLAYKIVGQLVKLSNDLNKPLLELSLIEIKNSIHNYDDFQLLIEIMRSITINSSLRDRISFGSSGINEQKKMIKERIKKIGEYRIKVNKRCNETKESLSLLLVKIKHIIDRV